ncbi:hypothetical protein ACAY19_001999 [Serratia liquefaciens]
MLETKLGRIEKNGECRHFAAVLLPLCCHLHWETKKPPREKWLNHMILKLKFGGPYWT